MELRHGVPYAPYERLGVWLAAQTADTVSLSFTDIEAILGHRLPPSAWSSSSWWRQAEQRQVLPARSWCAAGWHLVTVDRQTGRVTYTRIPDGRINPYLK